MVGQFWFFVILWRRFRATLVRRYIWAMHSMQIDAGGKTRTRPGAERSLGAQHDRHGGHWAVHRDSAGDCGHGRAAMPAGVGGGRDRGAGRCVRVGGTGRGDAGSGRQLRLFARGVRASEVGAAAVVPGDLADDFSGTVGAGVGLNRIRGVFHVSGSARQVWPESGGRRGGNHVDDSALPPHHDRRQNFDAAVDRRVLAQSRG